ncbi:hypothetical protein IMAU10574_03070 [Lactiplantibacillus plantarum]|nr:hypothetical protein [Lactiplantibacillus plantarum]
MALQAGIFHILMVVGKMNFFPGIIGNWFYAI